ncbi:DUF1631 domain-containing protein [Actinomadura craniellae]|uniref:DUF1631 domain-containing protein n=1 Tax=Actinomadura craniellae TaxID=2231787 RepID=UPI0011BD76EC|nr:DUF1631 domain-containing protein [Actinomadura craniellae]
MSGANPLPRAGDVFFDVRGEERVLRLGWHPDAQVMVISIWNGGECSGTFRLSAQDVPAFVEALSQGLPAAPPRGGRHAAGGPPPAPPAGPTQATGPAPGFDPRYTPGPGPAPARAPDPAYGQSRPGQPPAQPPGPPPQPSRPADPGWEPYRPGQAPAANHGAPAAPGRGPYPAHPADPGHGVGRGRPADSRQGQGQGPPAPGRQAGSTTQALDALTRLATGPAPERFPRTGEYERP